ncbi:hypothetical protein DASC09_014120 [Saccharomycopsis crataegensis]|uniref:Uncharacterized protein n=1 Tax=Saccharomycopsis crataegensis TaxID=43959 RepID=A0AAV5QHH5_9ASCO|nr:hypothetical protein DASC09_014120 [Saccharomycopsis crataegensis]
MTVPPPYDPVLLREHAYQDTKIVRLVLPNQAPTQGFLPLHLAGLGSFDYQLFRSSPSSFDSRAIDLGHDDPNFDKLANNSNNRSADVFFLAIINISGFCIGVYLIQLVARKLWNWNGVIRPTSKNLKNLRIHHDNQFSVASSLEDGVFPKPLKMASPPSACFSPDMSSSSIPSLTNTPVSFYSGSKFGHARDSSLVSIADSAILQTPSAFANNDFGLESHQGINAAYISTRPKSMALSNKLLFEGENFSMEGNGQLFAF